MKTCTRAALAAVPLCALAGAAHGGFEFGQNLINNAGGESGPGGSGQVVPVPGWSVTEGLFTVADYDATADLLASSDIGPSDRGANYFTGGNSRVSTAEQRYNLFPLSNQINAGLLTFELSGWLGSANSDGDAVSFFVSFLDSSLDVISTHKISAGAVPARGDLPATGLFYTETDGFIPVGAREAVVELQFLRAASGSTFNDGAADNLFFAINAVPSPGPAALFGLAGAVGMRRRR